jgi:hypothetical protein
MYPAAYSNQKLNIPQVPSPLNQFNHFNTYPNAFSPLPPINVNGIDPTLNFRNNNFKNSNTLMQNNLADNILIEDIKEYSIYIDSKDRNYEVFPNPFKYKVTFKPPSPLNEIIKGVRYKSETPNPTIDDNLKNVKYIRLEHIMLPYYYKIKENELDRNYSMLDNLYFILNIDEFNGENRYATNDILAKSFGVVYHDYNYNQTHFVGVTKNTKYVFPPDNLGKIDSLTINITDPFGNIYNPDHLDKKIKTCMGCICDQYEEAKEECYFHSLKHPLNPMFQNHIHLKVGVVEPKMNKLTFS